MAPRKSKKDKSKGNKEKNDGSSSKLKPPPPPAPAAAAVAFFFSLVAGAAAVVSSSTNFLQNSKKKANDKSLLIIPHPYMMEYHKNYEQTLEQIQKMEESVLLKLIDRSKWRSYPSAPQQCYEKDTFTGRISHLKIIGITRREQMRAYRHHVQAWANRNNNNNNHHRVPRIVAPIRMWKMTKDIAIMDQLRIIELYCCTGLLPKSMNYLTRLTTLQLNGCRDIDLSLLGCTLRKLTVLYIKDCENLTPSKFQNLSNLKRITLMRGDRSNNNTINLGERWINELSLAVTTTEASTTTATSASLVASSSMNDNNTGNNDDNLLVQPLEFKFQFRCSLQHLTFSGSCITNKDLGNIFFKMLYRFPNLDTLIIEDNPEINSFKEACENSTTMTSSLPVRSNLRTLKLSGTRIKVNNEELDSVIDFLEKLYPTVGIMKVFKYCTSRGVAAVGEDHNAASKVRRIEYLLAMNSTNAFGLTGTTAGNSQINDSQIAASLSYPTMETNHQHHHHHQQQQQQQHQQHKQPPLSVWPLALYKAFNKSYRTCNQNSNIRDENRFKKEIRHDVVYHLLRNGPIFSSNHTQRYKRRREYYSRGCKKFKAC